MGRTEYYDDPAAPRPNSLVPAATVFVEDSEGRILLVRRSDNGLWALPGGVMELGESIGQCAEREVLEETGYRVEVSDVVGIYSDPKHIIEYSDGEVRQQFAICLRATLLAGSEQPSEETPEVAWVDPGSLDQVAMHASTRLRIDHGRAEGRRPYVG